MHANIEFSSHSNHHHFFFILLLLLLPMPADALPSSSHTIKNEIFFLVPLMLYHLQWIDGWKRSEWDGMKSICMDGCTRSTKPFSNFLTTSIQISFLEDFHIFTSSSKRNPFCVFFSLFLYCYVADYADAAAAAYIDGNHTWKLSPMNWLLCVYVNVNLLISLFRWMKKGVENWNLSGFGDEFLG